MIRKDDMDPPMVSFMPEMSHTSNILLQEQQVRLWFHVPSGPLQPRVRLVRPLIVNPEISLSTWKHYFQLRNTFINLETSLVQFGNIIFHLETLYVSKFTKLMFLSWEWCFQIIRNVSELTIMFPTQYSCLQVFSYISKSAIIADSSVDGAQPALYLQNYIEYRKKAVWYPIREL